MSFKDPDYNAMYERYKKLPAILATIVGVLFFILSIVDASAFRGNLSGCDSTGAAVFFWWFIGAIVAFGTWFFTALKMSATIKLINLTEDIKNKEVKVEVKTEIKTEE